MMTLENYQDDKSNQVPAEIYLEDKSGVSIDVYAINQGTETHTNLVHLKNQTNPSKMTLVYFHGNSSCLGKLYPFIVQISFYAQVDIIAVEYPGFGDIKGPPSDIGVLKNATAAYEYITHNLKISPTSLILYGQSMGTGPATFLSAHPDYPTAGVVLESAFASGLKTMSKSVSLIFSTTHISSNRQHSSITTNNFWLLKIIPYNHRKLISTIKTFSLLPSTWDL